MNFIVTIVNPVALDVLTNICAELKLPIVLSTHGYGTATNSMRELLGIASTEKRIVIAVGNETKTEEYIKKQRKRMYIDAPGNGISIAVPLKSVGSHKALEYLSEGEHQMKAPVINYEYELITVIANQGCTDMVMDAAREAGARGGTVIHAKGTGGAEDKKFHKVSIAQEKEVVLILAKAEHKAKIMSSVLSLAGPNTAAGALVFSSPVTQIAGFSLTEEPESSPETPQ